MYFIGYDIGSSAIKAALLQADTGSCIAAATSPEREMPIQVQQPGWAEQEPESWWQEVIHATRLLQQQYPFDPAQVKGIGIAYQMHGLVCVDHQQQVLRPAIIWCDSRAVNTGEQALQALGADYCLSHLLNAPGNFTAAKLRWVQENEPPIYERIHRVMLPGDFIAMKLTGEATTTVSGLSEGICWDYLHQQVAHPLLHYFQIDEQLLSPIVPTFGIQGYVTATAAAALGLAPGTPVTYRAGDQPNNAFSLQVMQPGEAAATAGTSGVVYAVHDKNTTDPQSRVNTFVHVNNDITHTRNGVLMCLNGTGIANSWLKNILGDVTYPAMNDIAAAAPPGAGGIQLFPFGNGAERILGNKSIGATVSGLDFNRHNRAHLLRAVQEGIAFGLHYGMGIMREMGLDIHRVRAGHANMFLSPLFCEVFANTTGVSIELFNTDGAQGAARGAAIGAGNITPEQAFRGMHRKAVVEPVAALQAQYRDIYGNWLQRLSALPD
ncbi:xylulokinase [Chitinophaga nivalis]|uniref:FGGY family carbohydrate kinase n=1 Tax=Chitinophaga nivalis TaxID=2991709 RepID=A0ABT3IFV4_9BACT|nr:FGGY family carbohydrate kinase [Chitinophaga nivalis]MCW3467472.1 FGGY family carbohydrate kinase [Chitinophaga nivalis]MCW3482836.1 FGGY family carbohydrate kinase [Chitinophaga nivalis]